ncbi:MAG: ribosome small subunit-dependent GTPase A [Acidobacteriota bacterium]
MRLEDLGYGDWQREKGKELAADEARLARVVTVDREAYTVAGAAGVVPAEATGRLLHSACTPEDLPCVGDWVVVDYLDGEEHAIVHGVLPRRTVLRRRSPGGRAQYQPIAANVDVAYVVQSCDADFSLNRLDRYVVMAADGGITPRLLLTKCDLVASEETDRLIQAVKRDHGIEVAAVSSVTAAGWEAFARALERGVTYCLLGSSGVGKSTLLNRLLGSERLAVGTVREKDGRGRHTTTRRQLVALDGGALLIDTPGMRELGMMAFGAGLEGSFQDIADGAGGCRYADCTHTVEEGCAILAAVAAGTLSPERYQSYLKLLTESEHHEMTRQEKRTKDRAFGKRVKSYGPFNRKT